MSGEVIAIQHDPVSPVINNIAIRIKECFAHIITNGRTAFGGHHSTICNNRGYRTCSCWYESETCGETKIPGIVLLAPGAEEEKKTSNKSGQLSHKFTQLKLQKILQDVANRKHNNRLASDTPVSSRLQHDASSNCQGPKCTCSVFFHQYNIRPKEKFIIDIIAALQPAANIKLCVSIVNPKCGAGC